MTRSIVALTRAIAILVLVGCGSDEQARTVSDPSADGWVATPVIDDAIRTENGLRVRGHALPGSRIVLRGETGMAFAVGAGDDGRFDIRMPMPTRDTLYVVQIQVGEDAVPAVSRLLVSGDPGGPIALIGAGSPTRRLDPGAGLDVIDSDGRNRVASGRAAPGSQVSVVVNGRQPVAAQADDLGRWSLDVGAATDAAVSLSVDGEPHVYPGERRPLDDRDQLVRTGQGTALQWRLSETASQTSWFPDRSDP